MTYRPERMKFGIFLAPFHRVGENLTLALQRNLRLIDHLDELGFDEAWIGEHHSAARETIADPVAFIAAAAGGRTRRIRLGTGVLSLPYHHPLMVADRMQMLDHLTHGRAMLGVGPGALTSDAYMMGIEPTEQRRMMYESLEAILALLRGVEPVTMGDGLVHTARRAPADAQLHQAAPGGGRHYHLHALGRDRLGPLPAPACSPSPARATTASRRTWSWVEDAAAEHGNEADRGGWRVVLPIHHRGPPASRRSPRSRTATAVAPTSATSPRSTRARRSARPSAPPVWDARAAIDDGGLAVGTPDDVIEQIEGVLERSGGLGGILCLAARVGGHAGDIPQLRAPPRAT